ncbi:unnamed protein product [Schistosoma mattheei]|uniref:Uncharacterized protein n=1 Tax=Schistosoma mattheei TaxID=31246 RepID=A0A3P8H8P0_9TREM|nr:unnamed protein product [Schistosoma mattheei]
MHNAIKDEFTAKDNSSGSSCGITDVRMRVHSRNSLYRFRRGSAVPVRKDI